MKLKNKLLPLVGVGAVCATVTPLAMLTSCGTDNGGWMNALDRYVPDVEQHAYTIQTENGATGIYGEALEKNPKLYKEDFYWNTSNVVRELQERQKEQKIIEAKDVEAAKLFRNETIDGLSKFGYTANADKVKKQKSVMIDMMAENHDVKLSKLEAKLVKSGADNVILLSYELKYRYLYTDKLVTGFMSEIDSAEMTGTTTITNVPYHLVYASTYGYWSVEPFQGLLLDPVKGKAFAKDHPWSLGINTTYVEKQTVIGSPYGDYTVSNVKKSDLTWSSDKFYQDPCPYDEEDMTQVIGFLREDGWCYSYYMYNVAFKPEPAQK